MLKIFINLSSKLYNLAFFMYVIAFKGGYMSSIKDVAREAQVSIATVSRVFNNPAVVSNQTKTRVYSAAEKLGYTPNFSAKTMRKSIVGTIIVMIPDISNTFFIDIVRGAQDYAETRGYNILMGRFDIHHFDLQKYIKLVKSKAADGIVMAIGHNRHFAPVAEAKGIPIVTIEEEFMGNPYIYVDNFEAISEIVEYLISKKRSQIGFLGFKSERERLLAFKNAITKNNLKYDEELIKKGDEFGEAVYASAREYVEAILKIGKIPDAVVCASDVLAAGVIKWLIKNGLRVPQDVAVTGFDNIEVAELVQPGITTVEQPREIMGREAARLLINKIEGHEVAKKIAFQTRIVVRESA